MGQQQLLLIVLGVIIVGIAILLGIVLFRQSSIDGKRDLLINEGMTVANNAKEYFHKPTPYGGGGYSFTGWQIPSQMTTSANGSYTAIVNPTNVEITGIGNELVSGTDLVEVKFIVTSDSLETIIIH
ncbi:MAG: hypothetical protein IT276_04870 [Ignavibacteriaceae bacterium]|nr:hypothetical protein [Ignavibacteriaceae bacterium]HRN27131.1 hypothetical protein [Ignavibacteriaceae bacterium]HRP91805.1 hypothetical protein [Ignavibacteriaceae bacterium]HRQ55526.1 hypothetical protein [Ignavibacteriaceae bacterium]